MFQPYLCILQQRISPRRIKRRHAHIHAPKSKHPSQSLRPKILRRPGINTLKRMQRKNPQQKRRSRHRENRRKILLQHMRNTQFIMPMRLLQESQISLEAILALPFLDLPLHSGRIGGEFEGLAVAEPDVVVGLAFEEFNALGFEGGVEVVKGFAEEVGQEEERGALVESLKSRMNQYIGRDVGRRVFYVALMVNQRTSSAGKVILLVYIDFEAGLCKSGSGCNAPHSGTFQRNRVSDSVDIR